jgi:energy-coupling factor transport system ATP-binding protein
VIALENVSFEYADTAQGVRDIYLTVAPGECVVLTGRSGNDTSTQFFTDSVSEELLLCSDRSESTLSKARELLSYLELYEYKDAHPAALSGGQKQRLSIACGLLSDREILIFDEPTSGLDGKGLQTVSALLKQAASSGKCLIVITHDNELIRSCCTHIHEIT